MTEKNNLRCHSFSPGVINIGFFRKRCYVVYEKIHKLSMFISRILFNQSICTDRGIFLYEIFSVIFYEVQVFFLGNTHTAQNVLIQSLQFYIIYAVDFSKTS